MDYRFKDEQICYIDQMAARDAEIHHLVKQMKKLNFNTVHNTTRKMAASLVQENWPEYVQGRLRYTRQRYTTLLNYIGQMTCWMEDAVMRGVPGWLICVLVRASDIPRAFKQLKKAKRDMLYYQSGNAGSVELSPEKIRRAREYPITDLVDVNRQLMARCINHKPDKNPSMWCKNNYAKCFSCGWKGDAIAVCMKVKNIGFREAVTYLTQ